ncbi:hypothetical protein INR49_003148 [Caranx melampygus]|nr:hypothetical protein INR49_003148 [Caranx melampygus]
MVVPRRIIHSETQSPEPICYHMGSETDPDQRDQQTDRSDIDILQRYVARCLPGLLPQPAVVESCMYTVT